MITLAIPLPPSVNKIWRQQTKGRGAPFLSPVYTAWQQEAGWSITGTHVERIEGPYAVCIHVPHDMAGDIDNRVKPILDLCKKHVTDDDKHCWDQRIVRSYDVPTGTCVVQIWNSTTAGDAGVVRPGAGLAPAPITAI